MPRKDGATTRKERMEYIARAIMKALAENETLVLSKTVAELSYQIGLSEAKVIEYSQTLERILPFSLDYQNDVITKDSKEEATE